MPLMPFPPYAPDISPFGNNTAQIVQNVYPRQDGYGPVNTLSVYSQALSDVCRGLFYARNADASITIFAATKNRLWRMNTTDFSWTDVSKGGIAYSDIPNADQWQFAQFNNLVIAVQINTVPQVYDLTGSSPFGDLAAAAVAPNTPPPARYIAVVNLFIVLSGMGSTTPYRIQWSALDSVNAANSWTPGLNQSDFQDLPDGGIVRGVAGGEYGLITQDSSIRRMTFAPGTSYIFQIERVAQDTGIFAPLSLVRGGDRIFYCGNNGFQMVLPGAYPSPIGKERVDRTFFGDVDIGNLQLMIGSYDPNATRILWGYKSQAGSSGLFDKILIYDYTLDKWSVVGSVNKGEFMATLAKPGLTLENLDAIAPGVITISAAASGTASRIRLTVSGLTAGTPPSNTNLNVENSVEIYSVTGGVPAGNFPFTIFDSTHIELLPPAPTFSSTGTGKIGGALDQLPFSLDSVSSGALAGTSIVNPSHQVCFVAGPACEATLETVEQALDMERRVRVRGLRLISDAPGSLGSIGARENIQQALTYSAESQVNDKGFIPLNVSTRMARAHLRIPAGTVWSFASAVDPLFSQEGKR